jgi:sodium-dependent dicarboxylate transporter 2/3/5
MKVEAQRVAAITLLMATWWISESIPIPATAMIPLALYPLMGVMKTSQAAAPYAHHMVFLFLGGFLIALAMEKWNLHRRIALYIIKAVGASPSRLVLGFMLATAFLSMWISNTATTMMMLPIAMAVVTQLAAEVPASARKKIEADFGLLLMLGIAYAASIGGIGTLIGTPPNVILAGCFKELFPQAPEISFVQWMMVGIPLVVIFLPIAWYYLINFVSKASLKGLAVKDLGAGVIDREIRALGKMSKEERYMLIIFILTALLWTFRGDLELGAFVIPGWSNLFAHPEFIHDSTVAMFMGLLLFLIPVDWGKRTFLMDWETTKHIPWGILILFGGGFALARGMQDSGLALWIGDRLACLKGIPILAMVVCICFLLTFLTEVTSNTATATMMMPVLASMAIGMEIHPLMLMIPAAMSVSCAFMLPVATPPNAIVMGSGWVTIPQMSRAGLAMKFMGIIITTAVVYFIAIHVFGITMGVMPDWAMLAK